MELSTTWSEAEVRAMLAENKFTYQKVSLPYGLQTGGNDRSATADLIYPADMTGKTVFDLGCMYGFFGFEAERRGAKGCVGGEIDPENLAKCQMLADCCGSIGEFRHFDIERDEIPSQFDYVLCLNVLHHLRNPFSALEKLIAATRDTLVLEVASFGPKDRKKNRVPKLLGRFLGRLPIIFVGGSRQKKSDKQTFFITEPAIKTLLAKHRHSFAKVETLSSGYKGRFTVIARKRRIGHLFVIAGVPAGGKSTLIDGLMNGELPELAREMGFDADQPWNLQLYGQVAQCEQAEVSNMLLHYNITGYLTYGDLHRYDRGLLDLMETAERVTIVTTLCPAEELLERYRTSRIAQKPKDLTKRQSRKIRDHLALYGSQKRLDRQFRHWFSFVRQHVKDSPVVFQDEGYQLCSVDDWEQRGQD